MDKMLVGLISAIILIGICFWIFNNPNGINDGMSDGASRVNTKTSTFDYSGTVGPGASQTLPTGN